MSHSLRHVGALVLALFFYGLSFPVMKQALERTDWLTLLFFRFLFALALLGLFAAWRRPGAWRAVGAKPSLWLMGACNFLGMALQMSGIALTGAAKSAVLTQLMVVVTPLLAWFILGERFTQARLWAALLSFAGAVVLSTGLDFRGLQARGSTLGDLLVVSAVVFWSLTTILMRRSVLEDDPFPVLLANTSFTLLLAVVAAPWLGLGPAGPAVLAAALFLAVFCTIVPTWLFVYSLQVIDATTSAIVGPLEIVSAALVAFLMLGESMRPVELLGTALILASVYLVAWPGRRAGWPRLSREGRRRCSPR